MSGGASNLRRDVVAVTVARILTPLLGALLIVVLARTAGPAGLGEYTYLMTIFQLLEYVKSCGLPTLLVRECAGRGAGKAEAWRRELIRFGLWGALLSAPLMVASGLMPGSHLLVAALPFVAGLFPSAFSMANEAYLLAAGRSPATAWLALGEGALRIALSVAVVRAGGGIVGLAAIYALCRGLHALVGTLIIGRAEAGELEAGRVEARAMLRKEAMAYATVFVLPLALFRMDVIMLGWIGPASSLGIYVAAMRLFSVGLVVPDGVLSAVFATLSRLHGAGERAEFRRVLEQTALALGSLLVVVAAAGTLAAPVVVRLLFGEAFEASAAVLRILLWALPLFAWNRALGDALVATGNQRVVGFVVCAALGVALVGYPALIKAGGVTGAAWALVGVCVLIGSASAHFAVRRGLVNLFDLAVYAMPLVCGLASQAAPTAALRGAALALAAALTVWLCWTKLALPQRRAAAAEAMTGVLPL